MQGPPFRVLFVSQRNSARSIMAEAIANAIGHGEFQAFSAGVRPADRIDPVAVELLEHAGIEPPNHPPQHLRAFSTPGCAPLDFVFTLSDTAAGEAPPIWPGRPFTAHWRCDDAEKYETEAERRMSLMRVRGELERRLRLLTHLPVASLDRLSLHKHLGN